MSREDADTEELFCKVIFEGIRKMEEAMRVSDVFLKSYQPNNDLDADLIADLRDLRKLAREILRDSGPASEPLFERMVPKAGWQALKAHLETKP